MSTTGAEALLADGLVREGAIWRRPDREPRKTPWDAHASESAIHAALATTSVEREAARTADQLAVIEPLLGKGVLLDMGCGYGRIAKYLLPRTQLACYIGVDSSRTMLDIFATRHASSDAERRTPLHTVWSDIDELPVRSQSVDLVVVSAVFLHMAKGQAAQAIAEARRVLRPGGHIVVFGSFPNQATPDGIQGRAYLRLLALRGQGERNGPVRYYARREVEALFRGFAQVELRPSGLAVLPSTILALPRGLNRAYHDRIYRPLQSRLERNPTERARERRCSHFDVVARR